MLLYQIISAATYNLFSSYYVLNKILFDYLKAYHQITSGPEMEQTLVLLTSNAPSYDLPCLNIEIPEKQLGRRILGKEASPICDELEQTLTYMLKSQDT